MNIALIGYGKMGKTIEKILVERNHNIVYASSDLLTGTHQLERADVAIEFTKPEAAVDNILLCAEAGIPVVCGTTGWLNRWDTVCREVEKFRGSLFYASNFSLGVNLFFALNKQLAQLMAQHENYRASMTEIHHIHKKDAPSGTAITLAEGLIANHPKYSSWSLDEHSDALHIQDIREGEVPGTHTVRYTSENDKIEITHEAFSRQGFAKGAVIAAEWLPGKKGVFGMNDLLNL
ncbi:MAG: 4-hydroxy-tetrahydrodipicolinate reductase [Flavobacteriales bacterium]|nr:MAG: 4-hydroxy-tetrahydrodipicolinate reductase [Flavobacteriales bacterium]